MIAVELNAHRLIEQHGQLGFSGQNVLGVMAAALRDTMQEGTRILAEELAADINAPAEELLARVKTNDAVQNSRLTIEAKIGLRSRPIKLSYFSPVQAAGGVVYRPYKNGPPKFIRSAFGPNIPSLGRQVYRRETKSRLPVKKEPGLNLATDPVAKKTLDRVHAMLRPILERNIRKHVDLLMLFEQNAIREWAGTAPIQRGPRLKLGPFVKASVRN